jgi:hypothetical protein
MIRWTALLLAALAAPAAAAPPMLPALQPPTSTNPPPFGMDVVSSGIGERAAKLRLAVGVAFQKGLLARADAERLSLPLARIQQQLRYHEPRGYRERLRYRARLDAIQADIDRALAHS